MLKWQQKDKTAAEGFLIKFVVHIPPHRRAAVASIRRATDNQIETAAEVIWEYECGNGVNFGRYSEESSSNSSCMST